MDVYVLCSHQVGSAVTSTKRDVLDATSAIRLLAGDCWLFDPSGREQAPPGIDLVRWSPVVSAATWDTSRIMARSMVAAALTLTGGDSNSGSGGEAHFTDKAADTLAPMLYAAHHDGLAMTAVADWLYQADPAPALDLLATRRHITPIDHRQLPLKATATRLSAVSRSSRKAHQAAAAASAAAMTGSGSSVISDSASKDQLAWEASIEAWASQNRTPSPSIP